MSLFHNYNDYMNRRVNKLDCCCEKGEPGEKGDKGDAGKQGNPGKDGKSGIDIAGTWMLTKSCDNSGQFYVEPSNNIISIINKLCLNKDTHNAHCFVYDPSDKRHKTLVIRGKSTDLDGCRNEFEARYEVKSMSLSDPSCICFKLKYQNICPEIKTKLFLGYHYDIIVGCSVAPMGPQGPKGPSGEPGPQGKGFECLNNKVDLSCCELYDVSRIQFTVDLLPF